MVLSCTFLDTVSCLNLNFRRIRYMYVNIVIHYTTFIITYFTCFVIHHWLLLSFSSLIWYMVYSDTSWGLPLFVLSYSSSSLLYYILLATLKPKQGLLLCISFTIRKGIYSSSPTLIIASDNLSLTFESFSFLYTYQFGFVPRWHLVRELKIAINLAKLLKENHIGKEMMVVGILNPHFNYYYPNKKNKCINYFKLFNIFS
jgi:hypothetical protein